MLALHWRGVGVALAWRWRGVGVALAWRWRWIFQSFGYFDISSVDILGVNLSVGQFIAGRYIEGRYIGGRCTVCIGGRSIEVVPFIFTHAEFRNLTEESFFQTRLPVFSLHNIPNGGKYTKSPLSYRMAIKYTK
jgi:hypothetical protein